MLASVNDFDHMFGALDFFRQAPRGFFPDVNHAQRNKSRGEHGSPLTNIYDKGDSFEVRVEVAGLKKEDLAISLQGNELRIKGKRVCEPPKEYTLHRQERQSFRFSRKYALPTDVNPEAVEAVLVDGLLTLSLPKVAEAQVQEISIN